MLAPFTRKFRVNNPYKPDEQIVQDVVVSGIPQYDYSKSEWLSIDTEFLSLDLAKSKLCLIQIASADPVKPGLQRVELVWVWPYVSPEQGDDDAGAKDVKKAIAKILKRKDIELIMHVSTADLPRIEIFAAQEFQGKLFDTKVAGKIAYTETDDHSMHNLIASFVDPKFAKDKSQTSSQWDTSPTIWEERTLQYAMNDVLYLHPLKQKLEKVAERRGLAKLVAETMQVMPTLGHLYTAGYTESVLRY